MRFPPEPRDDGAGFSQSQKSRNDLERLLALRKDNSDLYKKLVEDPTWRQEPRWPERRRELDERYLEGTVLSQAALNLH